MGFRLKNKVALITGGSRGIGATTAELFAEEGAKVVITSRNSDELEKVAQGIREKHGETSVLAVAGDVGEENFIRELFQISFSKWGPLQILVNNAATLEACEFIHLKTETWDEIIRINLRGSFLCSREAFKQMKQSAQGGCIVNMSSLGGIKGTEKFPGLSAYVVSKHGIVGLTEALAVEGKEFGIRINAVAPGAVNTAMLKKAAPFLKTKTTPLDVAKVILFLCDEAESASINGSVIEIHSNE